MKCPNHPTLELTKDDFYYRGGVRNKFCKKCDIEKAKERNKKRNDFYKIFVG